MIDYDAGGNGLTAENVYFECNADLQGISVGFGDEYHHATHGQEIDITRIPAGVYYLTHAADPTNKWIELDDSNNTSWTKFQLKRDNKSARGPKRPRAPALPAATRRTDSWAQSSLASEAAEHRDAVVVSRH